MAFAGTHGYCLEDARYKDFVIARVLDWRAVDEPPAVTLPTDTAWHYFGFAFTSRRTQGCHWASGALSSSITPCSTAVLRCG